jgi:hypothetical protein
MALPFYPPRYTIGAATATRGLNTGSEKLIGVGVMGDTLSTLYLRMPQTPHYPIHPKNQLSLGP